MFEQILCIGDNDMTKKMIITIFIIAMIVTVGSAAVIYEYNSTATSTMTIEKPDVNGIETLVSSDGINFSESITLDNVSAGDSVVMFFSHENMGEEDFLFGTVNYVVDCKEGLEFKGPCTGSIHDFSDSEPGMSIMPMPKPEDECIDVEYGIVHTNTWGESYPVNSNEFVVKIDRTSAEILPMDYGVFDGIENTELTVTFVSGAHGTYTFSGTVETFQLVDIPRKEQELINETIGPI